MKPKQTLLSFLQCEAQTRKGPRCQFRKRTWSHYCGTHRTKPEPKPKERK